MFDAKHRDEGAWSRVVDDRRVHSFLVDKDERAYAHVARSRNGTTPVVLCQDLDQLFGAIAIVEGKARTLRESKHPICQRQYAAGTFFRLVASDVRKLSKKGPSSSLLKESSTLAIELGEHEGEFFANALIGSKSEDSAENIADAAQGLIALARLIARNEKTTKDVKKERLSLLRGLEIKAQGSAVKLHFRCESGRIARQINNPKKARRVSKRK